MHMMVSWEIGGAAVESFAHWNERLVAELSRYPWVRAMRTSYVVQLPDVTAYDALIRALIAVANSGPGVHLLISPPINGGQYAGVIKDDLWVQLNGLTGDAAVAREKTN